MKIDVMKLLGLKNGDTVIIENNRYKVIDCILDGEGPLHHKHIALLNGAEFEVVKEPRCSDFHDCSGCPLRCLNCSCVDLEDSGTLKEFLKVICDHYNDPEMYNYMLKRLRPGQ